jgi:acylphosphatase
MASSRRESARAGVFKARGEPGIWSQRQHPGPETAMERQRLQVLYTGHVQGVGFRYTVKSLASGFEVTGTIRNLSDGRVELVAQGTKNELKAFAQAIRDSGLGRLIADEQPSWSEARDEFRGFTIAG